MKIRARIAVLAAGAVVVTGGLSAAALAQGGALFGAETTIERASGSVGSAGPDGSASSATSSGDAGDAASSDGSEGAGADAPAGSERNGGNSQGGQDAASGQREPGGSDSKSADAGGKAMPGEDSLAKPGTRFESGDMLKSPNGTYIMGQQPDGDFVLLDAHGQRLWSTQTYDNEGAYTDFLGDGNLVTYSADGEPLFTTETRNEGATALAVQNDGNIVIYDDERNALWSSEEQAMKLVSGQRLSAGQSRYSTNGDYEFVQQDDGNLVMRKTSDGSVLWSSGTQGNPGAYTQMMPNGNLVTYSPDGGEALFATATDGHEGAELQVNNDGNAGIRATDGGSPWGTASTYDKILPNQELKPGQDRRADGYRLVQGSDGNLVLYTDGGKSIWSSGTKGHPGARTVLFNGNLMVVDQNDRPLWATDTAGQDVDSLVVQSDGNLVLYGPGNKTLWKSNTEQR